LILQVQLLSSNAAAFFEVHQVQVHVMVVQCKSGQETLIRASAGDRKHFASWVALVLLRELNNVGWFGCLLLQVPYLEILLLVDAEKLTDARRKVLAIVEGVSIFTFSFLLEE
jgi:hypothetical protein